MKEVKKKKRAAEKRRGGGSYFSCERKRRHAGRRERERERDASRSGRQRRLEGRRRQRLVNTTEKRRIGRQTAAIAPPPPTPCPSSSLHLHLHPFFLPPAPKSAHPSSLRTAAAGSVFSVHPRSFSLPLSYPGNLLRSRPHSALIRGEEEEEEEEEGGWCHHREADRQGSDCSKSCSGRSSTSDPDPGGSKPEEDAEGGVCRVVVCVCGGGAVGVNTAR